MVEHADLSGGRIFASQLNVNGPSSSGTNTPAALLVHGLDETDVELLCLQGSGNRVSWVEVVGGPKTAAGNASNQVAIYLGATGSSVGQYSVRNHGRLIVRGVYHEKSADSLCGLRLSGHGTLAIDATRFSYATSPSAPTLSFLDFAGLFTLATSILMPVDSTSTCRLELNGSGTGDVLALNDQFIVLEPGVVADKVWQNGATPPMRGGLAGCNLNILNSKLNDRLPSGYAHLDAGFTDADPARSSPGARALGNVGTISDERLRRHLEPLRQSRVWLPERHSRAGLDLQIYRVIINSSQGPALDLHRQ